MPSEKSESEPKRRKDETLPAYPNPGKFKKVQDAEESGATSNQDMADESTKVTPDTQTPVSQPAVEANTSDTQKAESEEKPPSKSADEPDVQDAAAIEPVVSAHILEPEEAEKTPEKPGSPPWTLQQFFNGEIDLDVELAKRFPKIPVLSSIRFRTLGGQTGRGVATLSSQDGGANLVFDADSKTHEVHLSFTFGSMITLRFNLLNLNDADRTRWLELMRREQGGLAFLWGPTRWESDYVICIARQYFTNLYAFSPRNFEAAIRMTPNVADQLLDWLETYWSDEDDEEDDPPDLLTW